MCQVQKTVENLLVVITHVEIAVTFTWQTQNVQQCNDYLVCSLRSANVPFVYTANVLQYTFKRLSF